MPAAGVIPGYTVAAAGEAAIGVAANEAGTYAGTLTSYRGGNELDTVSWTFTTRGKATSMTLTPASQSVSVNGTATMLATLKDANGNQTQPLLVDTVTTSVSPTGSGSPSAITTTGSGDGSMFDGEAEVTLQPTAAGTYTVTATPGGTLPAGGVTAQSATVTASGAVSTTGLSNIQVTTPANAVNASTSSANNTAIVPSGTSAISVEVTCSACAAGDVLRLSGIASAGTPSASAPEYVNVTLNSDKQATAAFTVGGGALAPAATFTVQQVNAANANINATNYRTIVTQTASAVTYSEITTSPAGNIVTKVGTTTNVTVTVANQFEVPQSGYTIYAYRGTPAPSTLLSSGTTNSSGEAALTVAPASTTVAGQSETYTFTAQAPGGSTPTGTAPTLLVNYTTDGTVSSMSVTVGTAGATTPITPATTSIAVEPYAVVPYDGVVSTAVTGTYTVATAAGTAAGEYVTFTPSTNPANAITVTVPEGAKVATSLTGLIWSGGKQTVSVASGSPVYVFATKTGTHDVTFASGGLTSTAKVKVATAPAAAYNIEMTPASQTLNPGSFGTVTVKVTDVFGNPVAAATGTATGGVTLAATGEVLLSGLASSVNVTTGTDGTAVVAVIAGQTGTGSLAASPQAPSTTPAWVSGYTPPTGAPAPVTSAASTVTISSASTKSITIVGSRTTISGRPGIVIDGAVTGIEDGKTVVPYYRFPGQTTFTQGSARPEIADGVFTWQRKTGKKFYAYVTNDDGSVKSNRVIIPAK